MDICINCKHYGGVDSIIGGGDVPTSQSICRRKMEQVKARSLIHGKEEARWKGVALACEDERASRGLRACGKRGKHWEAK